MSQITNTLKKLGYEEQEIKTYLALLDFGELTATKIAEKTALGRVHTYQITNKLIEKGLVSYVIKNNIRYFSAADPETILQDLKEKEEGFKKILPELKARQKIIPSETKVEVFRGLEGINTILKMILKEGKDYVMLGGGEQFSKEEVAVITSTFIKRAEQSGIKGRLLERKKAKFIVGKHEDYRFVNDNLLSPTTSATWGDYHAIFIWTRPFYVILINNKEIAESNLATFNYIWASAQKPTKKDREKRLIK